ncbi:site-specific DNA-methyltransferase [Neiella sp. HB171785]|uniref:site-specific DNA-methyltransferase (adenine-specific) n=1 Tax=Neiella litorisoli TaxID=2771431 RepID=A0A8J6QIS2_9GAMM|nr:site-specific DNA-methyltransferase [Neiella litorisoli]MBD1388856.1 site-specific DNA-methyltransferase [Neiella litorisoli]
MEQITNESPESKSMDITNDNIQQLKEIFPDVFTEGKVDFDALRAVLGDAIDDSDERYNFTWNGKNRARQIAQTPSTGTLRPCKEESVNWDSTENLFIEGDNLEVLKLLQKSYHKKVKMIYIDPPYNTGGDFVYKDNFHNNIKNYLEISGQLGGSGKKLSTNVETSGRYHSNWLNMIYPRLKLARNLLKDDGVIFISIDDYEIDNLRKVANEVFGEDNFLAKLIWNLTSGPQAGHFTRSHEYVLAYAKNKASLKYFKDTSGGTIKHGALKKISKANPSSEVTFKKGSIRYEGDNAVFHGELGGSEKQYIKSDSLKFENGMLAEDVTIEAGWAMKNQLLSWLDGKETFDSKGQKVLRFYFNSKGILFYEKERGTYHPKTVIPTEVGNTKTGSDQVIELLGEKVMDFPKPTQLVEFLIKTVSHDDDDIILDFFAGSGTTGHSLINQCVEDGIKRKFILVQLREKTNEDSAAFKSGYDYVSKITLARLSSIIKKYGLKDVGFKFYRLSETNIKSWDADFDDLAPAIKLAVDTIKEGRTDVDVLYEILLKYGIELTTLVEEVDVAGKRVFSVGAGALMVCLDDDVNEYVIEGIAKLKQELDTENTQVVFKDQGFSNSVVKTNAIQILKQYGIDDVKSI